MTELLVQGCSQRKHDPTEAVPPQQLYDGYFFRILDANQIANSLDLDVVVLSAEYGLLTQSDRITAYDTEMTAERAKYLNDDVLGSLKQYTETAGISDIWINVGGDYLEALSGIEAATDAEVHYFEGRLGERGHLLKQLLQGNRDEIVDELPTDSVE